MRQLFWISMTLVALAVACKKDNKQSSPTLTTTDVSGITSNSASTGGTISSDGGSAISMNGVVYAMHNNPSIGGDSVVNSAPINTGSFAVALANLNAHSVYYVRAYAVNGAGTGYGGVDSFTTSPGLATVSTTAITNNQELKATSGGNITNDGGAAVTARGLCWSTSPHPTTSDSKTTDGTGAGSFVDSLTGLSITTYYVRAYAVNSFGTSYGNEISFAVSTNGTVTDIDGNVYIAVVIGTQTWMGSNLKVTHYQNGDSLINGSSPGFDWFNSSNHLGGSGPFVGAYSFPNGDSTQNALYGKYYNSPAISDSRNICPAGWSVPTDADWDILAFAEGMMASDTVLRPTGGGDYEGTFAYKLKPGGSSGLNLQSTGYLFAQSPGNGGPTYENDGSGDYWSTTMQGNFPFGGHLYRGVNVPGGDTNAFFRGYSFGDSYVMSVRCVKN